MINKAILIGNLGSDPDLKQTQGGKTVCRFNVATSESYTDRNGNRVENTDWHRVSVWDKAAEACARYLHKGSKVYVEGSIKNDNYTDGNGVEHKGYSIRAQHVQFLDRKEDNGGRQQAQSYAQPSEMDDAPF